MQHNVLGLVPARGGSKSIPYKNIVDVGGRPLLAYVLNAARSSLSLDQLIVSTDDPKIAAVAVEHGVQVMERPDALSMDSTPVIDVILDVLDRLHEDDAEPDIVALLQPTSPFVLAGHIDTCIERLAATDAAMSVQTIARMPHNYHAFNQRAVSGGYVDFQFAEERRRCYNKQSKPELFVFGNFVATKSDALRAQNQVFATPSLAVEIDSPYALDIDGPDDVGVAEWYLETNKVCLEN